MSNERQPYELHADMISTNFSIRRGMWIVAFLTPAAVVLWVLWWNVNGQDTISAYYLAPQGDRDAWHAYPADVVSASACNSPPMRPLNAA